ncbi:hypothetical protein FM038_014260 [Shewanella eurypsychrophilus]|uniref:Transmembrane protein n=1 Tax=Shewanella eurypsychrophilus TaxID=2593656 RepID=A0ABX8S464_9GAMM|nr:MULTISPECIES: hypothetical protein [Shewanella]QXP44795.1 hypothetical protein FM038_014260 [Shewanella eurypsychrophilus]
MGSKKKHIFDEVKNVKRLLNCLYVCCALLLILDFVIHRHVSHHWERLWAFYPIYGFLGCVVLVLVASWMRRLLMRGQDYYNDEGIDYNSKNKGRRQDLSQHRAKEEGHDVDA